MKNNYLLHAILCIISIELFVLILKVNTHNNIQLTAASANVQEDAMQTGFRHADWKYQPRLDEPMEVKIVGINIPSTNTKSTANVLPTTVYNPVRVSGKEIPLKVTMVTAE